MQYVVIAMADDKLSAQAVESARLALALDRKYREKGFERVTFTDGLRIIAREELESAPDA